MGADTVCRTDSGALWEGLAVPRPSPAEEQGPDWEIELLPGTEKYGHHHWGIGGVIAGMAVMAGSLLLL